MTQVQDAQLSPQIVLDEMTKNGVTHVVWLPDSETNWLYQLMQAEPSLRLVPVSREGLAFSLAAGLATGGQTPIILIQNTGLMESGDSLRGWALGLNIPVVLMVGYRGWTRHGVNYGHRGHLHRALPERLRHQLLPLRELGRRAAHLDRVRGGPADAAARRRAHGRRVPRVQPLGGEVMFQTADMLRIFQRHRGDAIVVPGRGGRHWAQISTRPNRDAPVGDPAMGGHASFALGLALARPDDKVVLFDSEGDLLMNLGILPTIAEQAPANFYHFMLDNECYATTGGQPVPNAKNVAYDVIARGAGYPRAFAFDQLGDFEAGIASILARPGPVFVALKVKPEVENVPIGQRPRWQTRTRDRVLADLRAELGVDR